MSVQRVREYLKEFGFDDRVRELEVSSATVELAAMALGVEPARIAKTIALQGEEDGCILVVAAGDQKLDNKKFKETFQRKAKMLSPDEVRRLTGYAVGGVCPFAVDEGIPVFLDESLRRFASVFPAAGSSNGVLEMTCPELFSASRARGWVDVCKSVEAPSGT